MDWDQSANHSLNNTCLENIWEASSRKKSELSSKYIVKPLMCSWAALVAVLWLGTDCPGEKPTDASAGLLCYLVPGACPTPEQPPSPQLGHLYVRPDLPTDKLLFYQPRAASVSISLPFLVPGVHGCTWLPSPWSQILILLFFGTCLVVTHPRLYPLSLLRLHTLQMSLWPVEGVTPGASWDPVCPAPQAFS